MNHAVAQSAATRQQAGPAGPRTPRKRVLALAVLSASALALTGCGLGASDAAPGGSGSATQTAATQTAAPSSSAAASGPAVGSEQPTASAASETPAASASAETSAPASSSESAASSAPAAPGSDSDAPASFSAPAFGGPDALEPGFEDGPDYVRTYAPNELGAAAFVRDQLGPLDQHATFKIESEFGGDAAGGLAVLNASPEEFLATEIGTLADEVPSRDPAVVIAFYQAVAPYVIEGASETLNTDVRGLGTATVDTATIDAGRFFTYRDGTDASAQSVAPGTTVTLTYDGGWIITASSGATAG